MSSKSEDNILLHEDDEEEEDAPLNFSHSAVSADQTIDSSIVVC